ncbi:MAG TPA: DUF3592 domain-containing protein [Candidatus Acidoferrales bacterium]|jgi:hypothetical protein|nr:DUF3592 domain-containing protein [Candidatus Acidoferrales bacterium]
MNRIIPILVILAVVFYLGSRIGFWRASRRTGSATSGVIWYRGGLFSCVIGGLSLLVAVGSWIHLLHFTHVAVHTTGVIIEMREHAGKNGSITYAPTFRFQDSKGLEHTVSSTVSESPPAYNIGDNVPILYISSEPQSARIDRFLQLWALPILTAIGGSFFLLVGLIVICLPKLTNG